MSRTIRIAAPLAVVIIGLLFWQAVRLGIELGDPSVLTGWSMLAAILFLWMFNLRKKLSMVPLGRAAVWRDLHVVVGVVLLPVFWLHTGSLWPAGFYEQLIAVLFYLVFASGVVGGLLTWIVPRRINLIGGEIILERIPSEIARIREAALAAITEGVSASGHETLVRQYDEAFGWFFARPRFMMSHITGAARPRAWLEQRARTTQPYLDSTEQAAFDQLLGLMEYKNKVDAHHANQTLLRIWLLFHLPLSIALLMLVLWHTLLVHIHGF
jgi:hypothetical protein